MIFTELQFIEGNQSIENHSLGPHVWNSHDWAKAHPLGSQAQPVRLLCKHVKCWSHVSWAEIKDPTKFHTHKKLISLNLVHKFVYIPVSEHFILGTSRIPLNSMTITQVDLVLGKTQGHWKMCSFVTQHNAPDVHLACWMYNFPPELLLDNLMLINLR